jgi:predicted O-methyltransferase YrrM
LNIGGKEGFMPGQLLRKMASNQVLGKIVKKVLLISLMPQVNWMVEKILKSYETVRAEKGLDMFKGETRFYRILESGQLDMGEGEFSEADGKAIEKLVKMVLREGIKIVEIGSWKGNSAAVLAKTVADCHGSVFAVDHWLGSEDTTKPEYAEQVDVYSIFKHNMTALGVWDTVHPLVMDSLTASQIFADGILDLVFIDGDHRYEAVRKDISAWLPKLKDGGILCGHDCQGYYAEYPEEVKKRIEENLKEEQIPGLGHPGVIKGVYECFQDDYSIMPSSVIWYYIKRDTASTG